MYLSLLTASPRLPETSSKSPQVIFAWEFQCLEVENLPSVPWRCEKPSNEIYHLVISHSHGESPIKGGFNWNIIYKWAIFHDYVKNQRVSGKNQELAHGFSKGCDIVSSWKTEGWKWHREDLGSKVPGISEFDPLRLLGTDWVPYPEGVRKKKTHRSWNIDVVNCRSKGHTGLKVDIVWPPPDVSLISIGSDISWSSVPSVLQPLW